MESKKLYRFLREAEEVAEWINDQTAIAASEDYGRDVEHVELLIQVRWLIMFLKNVYLCTVNCIEFYNNIFCIRLLTTS